MTTQRTPHATATRPFLNALKLLVAAAAIKDAVVDAVDELYLQCNGAQAAVNLVSLAQGSSLGAWPERRFGLTTACLCRTSRMEGVFARRSSFPQAPALRWCAVDPSAVPSAEGRCQIVWHGSAEKNWVSCASNLVRRGAELPGGRREAAHAQQAAQQ